MAFFVFSHSIRIEFPFLLNQCGSYRVTLRITCMRKNDSIEFQLEMTFEQVSFFVWRWVESHHRLWLNQTKMKQFGDILLCFFVCALTIKHFLSGFNHLFRRRRHHHMDYTIFHRKLLENEKMAKIRIKNIFIWMRKYGCKKHPTFIHQKWQCASHWICSSAAKIQSMCVFIQWNISVIHHLNFHQNKIKVFIAATTYIVQHSKRIAHTVKVQMCPF